MAWTPAATVSVPVAQLLTRLASRQPLLGVSLTSGTAEVALVQSPYGEGCALVSSGSMIDSEALKRLVEEHQVRVRMGVHPGHEQRMMWPRIHTTRTHTHTHTHTHTQYACTHTTCARCRWAVAASCSAARGCSGPTARQISGHAN
jgi:hypothetical protein